MKLLALAAFASFLPTLAMADDLIVTPESFGRSDGVATIIVNVHNPLLRDIRMAFFECWSLDKDGKTIELNTGIANNIKARETVKAKVSFTHDVRRITDGACRFTKLSHMDRR